MNFPIEFYRFDSKLSRSALKNRRGAGPGGYYNLYEELEAATRGFSPLPWDFRASLIQKMSWAGT